MPHLLIVLSLMALNIIFNLVILLLLVRVHNLALQTPPLVSIINLC